ncbi:hypothetical protein R3P38DRAFT_3348590 [Favolaschia claudopus]|uniref:Uncharacterized protein n=1 Tax=Favolaschia claudopus TaxID=2862362 RepID=A0AAW0CWN4_9AGAR
MSPSSKTPALPMHSLRFQLSSPSLLSYWSDDMSVGPNLPLHTLSKPAIWFLYHFQVKKYIKTHEDMPLSQDMLDMFEAYLGYKYILSATKTMILEHICQRTETTELEECLRTHDMICLSCPTVIGFLNSPDIRLRLWTCLLLEDIPATNHAFLLRHYEVRKDIIHQLSQHILSLSDNDLISFLNNHFKYVSQMEDFPEQRKFWNKIFHRISQNHCPLGIQFEVGMILGAHIAELDHKWSERILRILNSNNYSHSIHIFILGAIVCRRHTLAKLLRPPDYCPDDLFELTCQILAQLTKSINSCNDPIVNVLCDLVRAIVQHNKRNCRAIKESEFQSLVATLFRKLRELAQWPKAAEAIVQQQEFQIMDLLRSGSAIGVWYACQLVAELASHPSTRDAVLVPSGQCRDPKQNRSRSWLYARTGLYQALLKCFGWPGFYGDLQWDAWMTHSAG